MRYYFPNNTTDTLDAQETQGSEGITRYKSGDGAEQGKPARLLSHTYSNGSTVDFNHDDDKKQYQTRELDNAVDQYITVDELYLSESDEEENDEYFKLKLSATDMDSSRSTMDFGQSSHHIEVVPTTPNTESQNGTLRLSLDALNRHNEQSALHSPPNNNHVHSLRNNDDRISDHSGGQLSVGLTMDTMDDSPRFRLHIDIPEIIPEDDPFNINHVPRGLRAPRAVDGRKRRRPFEFSNTAQQNNPLVAEGSHNNQSTARRNCYNLNIDVVNSPMSTNPQQPNAPRASAWQQSHFMFTTNAVSERERSSQADSPSSLTKEAKERFKHK